MNYPEDDHNNRNVVGAAVLWGFAVVLVIAAYATFFIR